MFFLFLLVFYKTFFQIDITYNGEFLGKDHNLNFIYVTRCRNKVSFSKLFYNNNVNIFPIGKGGD